ncbi:MAG: FixH family protein [Bacteroidia bacterium]|nr:FixH family protein [Bacteroidia bacterium]
MKLSWKHGIIAAFLCFAGMMAFFMYKMTSHNSNYVPKGYYEKGIQHQEHLDAQSGANAFLPNIKYDGGTHILQISLDSLEADSGFVFMQWPPNNALSKKYKFAKLNKAGLQIEHTGPAGNWIANMEFFAGGKKYVFSKKVWVE